MAKQEKRYEVQRYASKHWVVFDTLENFTQNVYAAHQKERADRRAAELNAAWADVLKARQRDGGRSR